MEHSLVWKRVHMLADHLVLKYSESLDSMMVVLRDLK